MGNAPKELPDGLRDLIDLLADAAVEDALAAAPIAPLRIARWRPRDLMRKLDPAVSAPKTD